MPEFTVIAVSAARGADEAEFDVIGADFESADEAMGYGRRMAEEAYRLAEQLNLDFDYSHVSVFEGDVPDEAGLDHESLVGAWLFDEDGVGWSTAAQLRETDETPPAGEA